MNSFLVSLALISGDQLSGLDYRVSQLESRMDAVEAKLGIKASAVVAPQPAQPVVQQPQGLFVQGGVMYNSSGIPVGGLYGESASGDCSNGQCGNGGNGFFKSVGRGIFGRRK